MKKKIIVLTDFSPVSAHAVNQAAILSKAAGFSLTLFHVLADYKEDAVAASLKLASESDSVTRMHGIPCAIELKEGGLLDTISNAVLEKEFDLMVIGTHGMVGLRQHLFGADIQKLVERIPIPVLVVQDQSAIRSFFRRIILPVSSHASFTPAIDAVMLFASMGAEEVHIYSIHKPGFEWSDQLLANIAEAEKRFTELGIRFERIREEQEGFSTGYARQTIRYANTFGADLMVMISVASEEFHSFAKAYKEALLLNEYHLPVLCAGGGRD